MSGFIRKLFGVCQVERRDGTKWRRFWSCRRSIIVVLRIVSLGFHLPALQLGKLMQTSPCIRLDKNLPGSPPAIRVITRPLKFRYGITIMVLLAKQRA